MENISKSTKKNILLIKTGSTKPTKINKYYYMRREIIFRKSNNIKDYNML